MDEHKTLKHPVETLGYAVYTNGIESPLLLAMFHQGKDSDLFARKYHQLYRMPVTTIRRDGKTKHYK